MSFIRRQAFVGISALLGLCDSCIRLLQPPVQRVAADAQAACGFGHVAVALADGAGDGGGGDVAQVF